MIPVINLNLDCPHSEDDESGETNNLLANDVLSDGLDCESNFMVEQEQTYQIQSMVLG